jgi:hypothetical protein
MVFMEKTKVLHDYLAVTETMGPLDPYGITQAVERQQRETLHLHWAVTLQKIWLTQKQKLCIDGKVKVKTGEEIVRDVLFNRHAITSEKQLRYWVTPAMIPNETERECFIARVIAQCKHKCGPRCRMSRSQKRRLKRAVHNRNCRDRFPKDLCDE